MRTAVILLAGGSGTRLRRSENKVYLPVGGRSLLAWSLERFEASRQIDDIVIVIRPGDADQIKALNPPPSKLRAVVEGGASRHASEYAGLRAIAAAIESGEIGLVLIHDAARPFVSDALLTRVVAAAREVGGAVPGLPFDAPLFRKTGPDRLVEVSAEDLRRVQTPQGFRAAELLRAYEKATSEGFAGVDTAESVQRYGDLQVAAVAGDERNIKVTFVEDLVAADRIASTWVD